METMTAEQKREIKQLWLISNYYFNLSQKIKDRLPQRVLSSSIQATADNFSSKSAFVGDQRRIMFLTAHLGSCAIRLVTIEDILGTDISRKRLQKYKSLVGDNNLTCNKLKLAVKGIIHFLLRNNIGHYEPHGMASKQSYNTMEEFLKKLTIQQIFESMKSVIKDIGKDIKNC
jgi:hypothetical protein